MSQWVPFIEGEYLIERSCLFASDNSAVLLEDAVLKVFLDSRGQRQITGRCRIRNVLMMALLEENDALDVALDLGEAYKFVLKDPLIKGGKVFSPEVKSSLQFVPRTPWKQCPEAEFEALWSGLDFLDL